MALIESTFPIEFPAILKREARLIDSRDTKKLKEVAKLITEGESVIVPIAGVMGFVCDGNQQSGIDQIYYLKDRSHLQPLVTAASSETRKRLIEGSKLHPYWHHFNINRIYDFPAFIIFPAKEGLPKETIMADSYNPEVDTVAIWWANYYHPTKRLEAFIQELKPEAFIVGSSCNKSKHESIENSEQAMNEFGRGEDRVAAIVYDRSFDKGRGIIRGSHTMLRVVDDKIVPHRVGSMHIDSFKQILGERLEVSEEFYQKQGLVDSATLDLRIVRKNRHYLKLALV